MNKDVLILLGLSLLLFANKARATTMGSGPIGLKLNNPLNIRFNAANNWDGQINPGRNAFAEFSDKKYGYRAAFKLLDNYVKKKGLKSIRQIISRWAPPEDNNNTEAYIAFVSKATGIPEWQAISPISYKSIIRAMAQIETQDKDTAKLNEGYALAFGV